MCRFDETCIYVPEHVDDEVGGRVDGEHEVGDGHDLLDAGVLGGARGLAHALCEWNNSGELRYCILLCERLRDHLPPCT